MTPTATPDGRDREPPRTDDGHHFVIDGRRWRATDPSIPDAFRRELVDELMAARRAVKASRGETGEKQARRRVDDAKTALGERAHHWWEQRTGESFDARIAAAVRALVRRRSESSICPSDVARTVGGEDWRALMPEVRRVAASLADDGAVRVTQKGETVSIREARGPVRIVGGPRL